MKREETTQPPPRENDVSPYKLLSGVMDGKTHHSRIPSLPMLQLRLPARPIFGAAQQMHPNEQQQEVFSGEIGFKGSTSMQVPSAGQYLYNITARICNEPINQETGAELERRMYYSKMTPVERFEQECSLLPFVPMAVGEIFPRRYDVTSRRQRGYFENDLVPGIYDILFANIAKPARMVVVLHPQNDHWYTMQQPSIPTNSVNDCLDVLVWSTTSRPAVILVLATIDMLLPNGLYKVRKRQSDADWTFMVVHDRMCLV